MEGYKFLIPEESSGIAIRNVKKFREVENILREIFNKYDCKEILVPIFEYVELYKNVYKDFDEEKIFKYIGKDGNVISLRWDFTIPIARHYFSQNTDKEARYSYFGAVYRKEKTYKGRSSEHYQAGIELVNNSGISGNIECLNILQEVLKNIGLKDLKLELGSAKFFNRMCELVNDREEFVEILSKKSISEMKKFIARNNELDEEIKNLLSILPRACGDISMLDDIIENSKDEIILNSLKELKVTYNKIKEKDSVIFDLSMCPTMEYYTCLMLKVYSPYSPEPIVSGGRYDTLYKNFRKNIPAIGMGFYLNNILKALEKEGEE